MPYYTCKECEAKYYSASKTIDTTCDKCGGEIKEEVK